MANIKKNISDIKATICFNYEQKQTISGLDGLRGFTVLFVYMLHLISHNKLKMILFTLSLTGLLVLSAIKEKINAL